MNKNKLKFNSIPKLSITNHEVVNDKNGKHVSYQFDVEDGKKSWSVQRRYNAVKEVHDAMSNTIKNMPEFPKKGTIFTNQYTEEFISNRKKLFNKWLEEIVKDEKKYQHPKFCDLFILEENKKEEDFVIIDQNSNPNQNPNDQYVQRQPPLQEEPPNLQQQKQNEEFNKIIEQQKFSLKDRFQIPLNPSQENPNTLVIGGEEIWVPILFNELRDCFNNINGLGISFFSINLKKKKSIYRKKKKKFELK